MLIVTKISWKIVELRAIYIYIYIYIALSTTWEFEREGGAKKNAS